MSIEVLKFTPYKKGMLIGFVDVFVPKMGIEIHGISLYEKNGKKWVNMPSREFTNDKGEKVYIPIMKFRDKDLHNRFCATALEAIEKVMVDEPVNNFNDDQQGLPF